MAMTNQLTTGAENIVPLPGLKTRKTPTLSVQRFKIQEYANPRTGSTSWRVSGSRRNGERIRENFGEQEAARCRQVELETEYLGSHSETNIRATKLSAEQVRLAECAVIKLGDDWQRLLDCVDCWHKHGKHKVVSDSPRLDDAVTKFKKWLDDEETENGNGRCTLREHSRKGLRLRVDAFANSVGNARVNEVAIEVVEDFLSKLKVSAVTRDNYRRAISRFFSWCIERPRRWTTVNPCKEIRIERDEKAPPVILTTDECKALLKAAEREGLAPYVALCLFGGLRPFEASRLAWTAVNLEDREIRLEGNETKTGRPRVVAICDTLLGWLKAHKNKPFFPSNWRRRFDRVKLAAGFGTPDDGDKLELKPWPVDVMRHTAISHYFRKTGSYGQTAEQFGNSEAIIKDHYQGRVSSTDTQNFYTIKPKAKR